MRHYDILDNNLIRDEDGRELIKFDRPIGEILKVENVIIVRLEVTDAGIPLNNNIFGVNSSGEILWQISDRKRFPARKNASYIDMNNTPVGGIATGGIKNKLYAWSWDDVRVQIDPIDGRIIDEKHVK